VTEVVIEKIVNYIREHHLSPGDRLPSEQNFLDVLGVSRPTLREALRSLSVTGLIDLQPGSGTFVGSRPGMLTLLAHGPVPSLLTTAEEIKEYIEVRRILEPAITAIAAERATSEDLKTLETVLGKMKQNVTDEVYDKKPWVDFHVALFQASHNRLLVDMATPIILMLSQLTPYIITEKGDRSTIEEFKQKIIIHTGLYEAIVSQDPKAARKAAEKHVESALSEWMGALELMAQSTNIGVKNMDHNQ